MNEYARKLFEKIKDKEDLSFNEMETLERMLVLFSIYDDLLDIQIGIKDNVYDLEYVKSRKNGKTSGRLQGE